jgi:hypothetical protein
MQLGPYIFLKSAQAKMFVVITPGVTPAMICIPNTCNDLHLIIFLGSVAEEGLLIGYHSKEQGYARGNLPLPLRFLTNLLQPTFRCGQGPPLRPAISHARPLLAKTKQFAKHNSKRFHV